MKQATANRLLDRGFVIVGSHTDVEELVGLVLDHDDFGRKQAQVQVLDLEVRELSMDNVQVVWLRH
jgi:hypothetical protein